MITKIEMGQLLSDWSNWWPNFKVGARSLESFYTLFCENQVTAEEAKAAGLWLASRGEEFLSGPSLMRAVKNIRNHQRKIPTPEEAWAKILCWAQGGVQWPEVRKQIGKRTETAIRSVGGWDRIRFADTEADLPFVRKNFIDAYSGIAIRDEDHATAQIAYDVALQLEEKKQKMIGGGDR